MLASASKLIRNIPLQSQSRVLCTIATTPTASAPEHNLDESATPEPTSIDVLFSMQSRRRVHGSPMLSLEAVAMTPHVQSEIESQVSKHNFTPRMLRKSAQRLEDVRSPDSMRPKRVLKRGRPVVVEPMQYCEKGALSQTVIRSPGTLAANTYVMSEARRCYPQFVPKSMLDFGAGIGVSVMAASRAFSHDPFGALSSYAERKNEFEGNDDVQVDDSSFDRPEFLTSAVLVDSSKNMQSIALPVLRAEFDGREHLNVKQVSQIKDVPHLENGYDIVSASYSLNEIVRSAMVSPEEEEGEETEEQASFSREKRTKFAERRLRKTIMALWTRTAPGGLFIVVEDGTAAGFETVVFARDIILNLSKGDSDAPNSKEEAAQLLEDGEKTGDILPMEQIPRKCPSSVRHAKVLAPCLHSGACPLEGSVTRHRLCRFEQRFNRPKFLRDARPKATGYEDEYFSYIVIQKLKEDDEASKDEDDMPQRWGRLLRPPLLRGKHIAIDVCTVDGTLERRVISKRNAPPGQYGRARRSKWGDVWPIRPVSKPQPLNF